MSSFLSLQYRGALVFKVHTPKVPSEVHLSKKGAGCLPPENMQHFDTELSFEGFWKTFLSKNANI